MTPQFTESLVADSASARPDAIGWQVAHGTDTPPEMARTAQHYCEGVRLPRVRNAIVNNKGSAF